MRLRSLQAIVLGVAISTWFALLMNNALEGDGAYPALVIATIIGAVAIGALFLVKDHETNRSGHITDFQFALGGFAATALGIFLANIPGTGRGLHFPDALLIIGILTTGLFAAFFFIGGHKSTDTMEAIE